MDLRVVRSGLLALVVGFASLASVSPPAAQAQLAPLEPGPVGSGLDGSFPEVEAGFVTQAETLADGSVALVGSGGSLIRVSADGTELQEGTLEVPSNGLTGGGFSERFASDIAGGFLRARSGVVDVDGELVPRFEVVRYDSNGSVAPSFGDQGVLLLADPPAAQPIGGRSVAGVTVLASGEIYLIVSIRESLFPITVNRLYAMVLGPSGELIRSFRVGGERIKSGPVELPDGRVGYVASSLGVDDRFYIAQNDLGNIVSLPFRPGSLNSVGDTVYVWGSDPNTGRRKLAALSPDLALRPDFGVGGVITASVQDVAGTQPFVFPQADGSLIVSPSLNSGGSFSNPGATFERITPSGTSLAMWRFRVSQPVQIGDWFGALLRKPGGSLLRKADRIGQPVGDSFSYSLTDEVPETFTVCVTGDADEDRMDCSAESRFGDDVLDQAIESGLVSTGSIGSEFPERRLHLVAEQRCSGEWIGVGRSGIWTGDVASSCDLIIAGPGQVNDSVGTPSVLLVEDTGQFEGLLVTGAVSTADEFDRLMFLDRSEPANGFMDEIRFESNPGVENYGAPRVQEPASVTQWAIDTGLIGYDTRVRAGIVDLAYRNQDRQVPGAGRIVDGLFFNGSPVSPEVDAHLYVGTTIGLGFNPADPDRVETDSVLAWVDQPGGTNGWDPGEPFDVAVSAVLHPLQLVALGDSYAAGEGATHSERDACARSPYSYSGQIEQIAFIERSGTFEDNNRDGVFVDDFGGVGGHGEPIANLVGSDADDTTIEDKNGNGTRWLYVACGGGRTDMIISNTGFFAEDLPGFPGVVDPLLGEPAVQASESVEQLQLRYPGLAAIEANAVTLTIGGNDAGFSAILEACAVGVGLARMNNVVNTAINEFIAEFVNDGPVGLWDLRRGPDFFDCEDSFPFLREYPGKTVGPDGPVGRDFNLRPEGDQVPGYSADEFLRPIIQFRLRNLYREINDVLVDKPTLLPEHVFVFGYPDLFAQGDSCNEIGLVLGDEFSEDINRGFFNRLQPLFNNVIRQEAGRAGFTYVDPVPAFGDQGICGDTLNGLVGDAAWPPISGKSFHPTDLGWLAYADAWVDAANAIPRENRAPNGLPIFFEFNGGRVLEAPSGSAESLDVDPPALPPRGPAPRTTAPSVLTCDRIPFAPLGSPLTVTQPGPAGYFASTALTDRRTGEVIVAGSPVGEDGNAAYVIDTPTEPGLWELLTILVEPDGEFFVTETGSIFFDDTLPVCPGPVNLAGTPGGTVATPVIAGTVPYGQSAYGTVTFSANEVTYTPDPGFAGVDTFSYQQCLETGRCPIVTVNVDYTTGCDIIGDGGTAVLGTPEDEVICGTPKAEYIHGGGGQDTIFTGGGADVVLGLNDGALNGNPETLASQTGDGVQLSNLGTSHTSLSADIVAVTDQVALGSTPALINPVDNDIAANGVDLESLHINLAPQGITADVRTDGSMLVSATPDPGEGPIWYTICDTVNNCSTGRIETVTVDGQNSPPQASDDNAASNGEPVTVDVASNDTDPDDNLDPQSVSITTPPTSGIATIDGTGAVTYVPDDGFTGTDTLVYEICDLTGLCANATLTVTVTGSTSILEVCIDASFTIVGTDGNDDLRGTSGDDVVSLGDGDDKYQGGGGNDIICGGTGKKDIKTGTGDDTVIIAGPGETKVEDTGGANTTITGDGKHDIKTGNGADLIITGDGETKVESRGGDDRIFAGDGKHDIKASDGGGNDLVVVGDGEAKIETRGGNDQVFTGDGKHNIKTGAGNDIVVSGDGEDTIETKAGNDQIWTSGGADSIKAGDGDDTVNSGAGNDKIDGEDGTDTCVNGEDTKNCETTAPLDAVPQKPSPPDQA